MGEAMSLAALGQSEPAMRLFGAGEALREAIGAPRSPVIRRPYEEVVETARAALGGAAFAAWAEGRAMSLNQAVALALEQTAAS